MAENQILPFAYADGANVLSQSDYQADNQRLIGHQPGIARSALENKALRQASAMAAGLAQFIADNQPDNVTDSRAPAEIAAMLLTACRAAMPQPSLTADTNESGYFSIATNNGERVFYIQWGRYEVPANSVRGFLLPVAFPSAAVCAATSFIDNGPVTHQGSCGSIFPTKAQINISNNRSVAQRIYTISIGY